MTAKKIVPVFILLIIAAAVLIFPGRTSEIEETRIALGTVCNIKLYTDRRKRSEAEELMSALFKTLDRCESLISARRPGTDISRINESAGIAPVGISRETYNLLLRSAELCRETEGAFNPLVGAVSLIWKIGSGEESIPPENILSRLAMLTDPGNLVLEYINGSPAAFLRLDGMAIDLGAIGKGWAADILMNQVLESDAAECAVINLGGNITVCGRVERAVGVQAPEKERGTFTKLITLKNRTASTSGAYERSAVIDGKAYHHIIDPATGYPVQSDIKSVTVISPSGARADALSTAIFVNPSLESVLGTDEFCIIQ